jgi:hypothetical protein
MKNRAALAAASILLVGWGTLSLASQTQDAATPQKGDPRLAKVDSPGHLAAIEKAGENQYLVALRGDSDEISKVVQAAGGTVHVKTPTTVTAVVTGTKALELLDHPAVMRLMLGSKQVAAANISASWSRTLREWKRSSLPQETWKASALTGDLAGVHEGRQPLDHPYTGKGVLVGVIESTMPDFRHPDFLNADGTTRFNSIWDMTQEGAGPTGFGFGRVYEAKEMNRLLKSGPVRMVFGSNSEHCTNSVGAVAGTGAASGENVGVAPDSTLIYVATGYDNVRVIDAVAYIFREADRLNVPCVISISMVANQLQGRADDGSCLSSVAVSELIDEKPGRFVVGAAGNQGQTDLHAMIAPAANIEPMIWAFPIASKPGGAFSSSMVISGEAQSSLEFQVSAVLANAEGNEALQTTGWMTAQSLVQSGPLQYDLTKSLEGTATGLILKCVPKWNSESSTEIGFHYSEKINSKARGAIALEFKFRGKGKAELWSEVYAPFLGTKGSSVKVAFPLDYVQPDNQRTISDPANGLSVLAAGAYSDSPTGKSGELSQPGGVYGKLYKPLALAPSDLFAANPLDSPSDDKKKRCNGLYAEYGGTSCATPMLAGAVALFLQKHPQATVGQFADAVKASAIVDDTTGAVPNPKCGYGRIDYFRLLQQ